MRFLQVEQQQKGYEVQRLRAILYSKQARKIRGQGTLLASAGSNELNALTESIEDCVGI